MPARHDPGDLEFVPGIRVRDAEAALDALEAWSCGRSNAAIRVIQQASARGAVPGLVAAFAWVTAETVNEFAGDRAVSWQASLRAQVEAARTTGEMG